MSDIDNLIGNSAATARLRALIERVASFDEPVLVVGETGVGKELVARQIHARSGRGDRPLQVIHCAGIGSELLAAELFGHRRGAFTGAACDREGRIRAADGASVVLDEVTETTADFQAALLRTIEQGEVHPVGMDGAVQVDVRFIATSNRPLGELASGASFRLDLFHRLAAFVIEIVPLRARREEIDELAVHFLTRLAERYGASRSLSADARSLLGQQPFPGNVRELRQVLLRAYALATTPQITARDIAPALFAAGERGGESGYAARTLEEVIRDHIRRTLTHADGNLSEAARLLAVPRSTLQHYLVKYGVAPEPRSRREATA